MAVANADDIADAAQTIGPAIVVRAADRERLLALLGDVPEGAADTAGFLRRELERAEIIRDPAAAASLVVMGSTVDYVEHDSLSVCSRRLAYPDEVIAGEAISILSPVGAALLGLGPGQSITWRDGDHDRTLTVLSISSPEVMAETPGPQPASSPHDRVR
jgi:transcription elongation GreA/GreB family factor